MKILNQEQIMVVSGGEGCICSRDNTIYFSNPASNSYGFIARSEKDCEIRCCDELHIMFCIYQDGPLSPMKEDLAMVNLDCKPCNSNPHKRRRA